MKRRSLTSIKFSYGKSVVTYIFDIFGKVLRAGSYEIQHVVILHLSSQERLRENIIQNWPDQKR